MKVAIIKYNAGNIRSVCCAVGRLGGEYVLTDRPEEILGADKVIFPGVGHAATSMEYLKARGLDRLIADLKQPTLGICVGLQLMCRHSEEGNADCIGIFDVPVEKFRDDDPGLKVPQMGWNDITGLQTPLFAGIDEGAFVYYVHSYRAALSPWTVAVTDYGGKYSAALHRDNFWATQFHPEKSGSVGETILKNFLNL
jgi:glutamine amidotransferase